MSRTEFFSAIDLGLKRRPPKVEKVAILPSGGDVLYAVNDDGTFHANSAQDVLIVDGVPDGPLEPSVDESLAIDPHRFCYGCQCASSLSQKCPEVANVPGWESYEFPELDRRKR